MATIEQLLSILPNRKEEAIHAEDIAESLELPINGNQVETRQLIREAIQEGHTIVSNTRVGYWVSSDKSEIQEYINSLKNRAKDTIQRADELRMVWDKTNPTNPISSL